MSYETIAWFVVVGLVVLLGLIQSRINDNTVEFMRTIYDEHVEMQDRIAKLEAGDVANRSRIANLEDEVFESEDDCIDGMVEAKCCRCGKTKECWFVNDPYEEEMIWTYDDLQALEDLKKEWWCPECYSDRKAEI